MVKAAFWILIYFIWSQSGPRWFREAFGHFWDRKQFFPILKCSVFFTKTKLDTSMLQEKYLPNPPRGRVQLLKTNWTFFHFIVASLVIVSFLNEIGIGLHLNSWYYISGCRVPCSWAGCWCSAGRPTTTPSQLTPSSGRTSFPSQQRRGSGSAFDEALLDPGPYWGCESGSRSKEIDKIYK